ncbi:hypothetical protein CONPUDRAFT_69702 [Coniophora puteana RWD-64-598 SS2]|uniref:F-box domain-containing protein n=1 Tax=Coniophora puteana (strain RWD-64-598) TaxID=741705 RepID=A0A5M3MZT5_CONPW|nr:uncharacterized protein CONPUDRAFT_69702 [Coniophora puteana RWD-64-598 SS2]EIW84660.1 hypothetical protein CONPUDRAFT_69702 [Coniophora puteana RWD-64-598 SS2]
MRHCLSIPELLQGVLWFLTYDSKRKSLARLSRTRKKLYDPALDALYYKTHEIARLLMLLPADSWIVGESKRFTRLLTKNDWNAFQKNSEWIRLLGHSSTPTFYVAASVLHEACLSPHLPLLPNLRTLQWTNKEFHGTFIPQRLFSVVALLGDTCASIQQLCLSSEEVDENIHAWTTLTDVLPTMASLRSLELELTSNNVLSILQTLPSLVEFVFVPPHDLPPTLRENRHDSLQYLYSGSGQFSHFCNALNNIGYIPQLRVLKARSTGHTLEQIHDFFAELLLHAEPYNLGTLTLVEESSWDNLPPEDPSIPIDWGSLRPLLQFRRLKKLVIGIRLSFRLTDYELDDMSQVWTEMEHLALIGFETSFITPETSLWGVAVLISNYVHLRILHLSIDAAIYCNPPPTVGALGKRVVEVDFHNSPIDDPFYVASYLSNVLPKYSYIGAHIPRPSRLLEGEIRRSKWEVARNLLKGLYMKQEYDFQWKTARGKSGERLTPGQRGQSWNFITDFRKDGLFWESDMLGEF